MADLFNLGLWIVRQIHGMNKPTHGAHWIIKPMKGACQQAVWGYTGITETKEKNLRGGAGNLTLMIKRHGSSSPKTSTRELSWQIFLI